ncbi:MAG: Multidrug transporter permease [Bacteroidetes bacterium]|nr:Multidrug transporter permease [Bacteroidota bacterium]
MMNTERVRVWIGFVIVSWVWGSTWLAIKIGLHSVPPMIGAGIRFLIASAILYTVVRMRKIEIPVSPELRRLYIILIFFSYAIPFGVVYWCQQFIPTGLSSILFGAYPLWVALISHFLLTNERLDVYKVAGILLGFIGVFIIFSKDVHWTDPRGFIGMFGILCTTLMQAFALVMIKKYAQPVNPFALNFVGMSVAGVLLFSAGLMFESFSSVTWDAAAVGSILYLAVVGSVIAFVTYHWLLKRVEAVYLSLVSFINPIIAVILGAIILDETLAASVLLGASFVLVGILIANGRQLYAKVVTRNSTS